MDPFTRLVARLGLERVRFAVIGVWAVNYYAFTGAAVFTTKDRDLFLPPDPENELLAWKCCEAEGYELWAEDEPLGAPRDVALAKAVVERRALTTAIHTEDKIPVDLTLVMAGFTFEDVWAEKRVFLVDAVEVPVARLMHIIESKRRADRDKDRLFLASHAEELLKLDD